MPLSLAGPLNDLFSYDPAAMTWTDLSVAVAGNPPTPRFDQGFESAGGKLYVFGGRSSTSGEGDKTILYTVQNLILTALIANLVLDHSELDLQTHAVLYIPDAKI